MATKYKTPTVYIDGKDEKRVVAQHSRYGLGDGYNQHVLISWVVARYGSRDYTAALARIMGVTRPTARKAIEYGSFTREEIYHIAQKLEMPKEYILSAFFGFDEPWKED